MIPLVKHFLLRARPKTALVVSLIALAWFFGCWRFLPSWVQQPAWSMAFFMGAFYLMIAVVVAVEAEEFDLVLPVRRRRVYAARLLALLLLTVIVIAPVSAVVFLFAAVNGDLWLARIWATMTLYCVAMILVAGPAMRLARQIRMLMFAMPAIVAMFIGMVFAGLEIHKLKGGIPSLLLPAVAFLVGVVARFLDAWQFEHYELVPRGAAGAAHIGAGRLGLLDRFPPLVRVLARGLWLRWDYGVLLIFPAIFTFIPDKLSLMWLFPLYGHCVLMRSSASLQSLPPLISRRTILRSAMGPMVAVLMLSGGVRAAVSGSAEIVLWVLATTLFMVGAIWLTIPSLREYRRPFIVRVRYNLWWVLVACILGCGFVSSLKDFFQSLLAGGVLVATQRAAGNSALLCCGIVLAIALLWWRCERKFRYFESFALPSGFGSAA